MREHQRITVGMTERARYGLLKKRSLALPVADSARVDAVQPDSLAKLEMALLKQAKPLLKKLAEEFGVFGDYKNTDIALDFQFSRGSLAESIHKQSRQFDDFAKMLTCFDKVIDGAVGIESHGDRYENDGRIKNIFVLAGGFIDKGRIIPVKLLIKETQEGTVNKLYIAVARGNKKETGFHGVRQSVVTDNLVPQPISIGEAYVHTVAKSVITDSLSAPSASNISIRQLIKNINPIDGDFLKYLPKQFLNHSQREAAKNAKANETIYIKEKLAAKALKENFGGNYRTSLSSRTHDTVAADKHRPINNPVKKKCKPRK